MGLQKIALIGANGHLGPSVLSNLLAAKTFQVTVLSRESSKSTYPPAVQVKTLSDDPTHEELVKILRGQDALVITFGGSNSALQISLADAAAEAGVKRIIPADFGSCDSSSPMALELVPLYRAKKAVRDHLQKLAKDHAAFSWTSLVCGHFFDYGLKGDLLQFDVKAKKVNIFDDGNVKWSASTLEQIGFAVAKVLEKEEATGNRMLYMQSLCTSQNEVLSALEKATGTKWDVTFLKSGDFIKQEKAKIDEDPKDHDATEALVSVVGIIDANWGKQADFANSLLELKEVDLEALVKEVLHS